MWNGKYNLRNSTEIFVAEIGKCKYRTRIDLIQGENPPKTMHIKIYAHVFKDQPKTRGIGESI